MPNTRLLSVFVFTVAVTLFAGNDVDAANPFKGFFTNLGSSQSVNQRPGNHPKVRVDTSEVEKRIRWNKAINDKLGVLGKLNTQWMNTKTPAVQYNFVPGHGWVETASQGNRQIEAYRRKIERR